MKYLSIEPLKAALIRANQSTHEHRTGTVASGLLNNYYPKESYIITPEQIQEISNKRPDFSVEKLHNGELVPHTFVEIKSLVNSNFNNIMDQLYDSILYTVDFAGEDFSVYIIAIKGVKIAFYEFFSYANLLDEYNISNYKGIVPLTYDIPEQEFSAINKNSARADYLRYLTRANVPTDAESLRALGVESTSKVPHPHIWNLLNKDHEGYVHELFQRMAKTEAGKHIK